MSKEQVTNWGAQRPVLSLSSGRKEAYQLFGNPIGTLSGYTDPMQSTGTTKGTGAAAGVSRETGLTTDSGMIRERKINKRIDLSGL